MITGIYAIKDAKSTFMPCTVDVNDATAVRNFEHAVRQPDLRHTEWQKNS